MPVLIRDRFNLPSHDAGIDGIYQTFDGRYVAYQAKYRQAKTLSFGEVSTFLSLSDQFEERVIFSTADTLREIAADRSRFVSGQEFRDLSEAAFAQIIACIKSLPDPVIKAAPDPRYQTQALEDIAASLVEHDRANVVMACGTGKTFVSLWATEALNPKTVLVLLPSLSLLKQTLKEWSEQSGWGDLFSYICVCSDKTVGLKNDGLNIDQKEAGFRVDTDPEMVRSFLQRPSNTVKVVFSTYQSSPVVGAATVGLPPFDVGIFDEAHKTVGLAKSAFGFALFDDKLAIRKRLFFTATPRHYNTRKQDKDGDLQVVSMDDETVYGPRAHTLTFGAAAELGVICPYKVVISLIDKQQVDDFVRRNGITLVDGDPVATQWVANQIALEKAVSKVDARKIITFHSRVNSAEDFASDNTSGMKRLLPEFAIGHVNGKQSSAARGDAIAGFADAPKSILTNARCLTEGVNIPAVDMVAFIDPRQNRVDIAQAVGRAMRKPSGPSEKTTGYILVPLFADSGDEDSINEAIQSERFDAVVDVLNAMREHDNELADILRDLGEQEGLGKPINPTGFGTKIQIIGPQADIARVISSITTRTTDRLVITWDVNYGLLKKFHTREGHCLVPGNHKEDGFRLGMWVTTQRQKVDKMSPDRKDRLNALGFVWDPHAQKWEEGFAALKAFHTREGHCLVPDKHQEDGFRLGTWVGTQRSNVEKMSPDRKDRLNALGFVWSVGNKRI